MQSVGELLLLLEDLLLVSETVPEGDVLQAELRDFLVLLELALLLHLNVLLRYLLACAAVNRVLCHRALQLLKLVLNLLALGLLFVELGLEL